MRISHLTLAVVTALSTGVQAQGSDATLVTFYTNPDCNGRKPPPGDRSDGKWINELNLTRFELSDDKRPDYNGRMERRIAIPKYTKSIGIQTRTNPDPTRPGKIEYPIWALTAKAGFDPANSKPSYGDSWRCFRGTPLNATTRKLGRCSIPVPGKEDGYILQYLTRLVPSGNATRNATPGHSCWTDEKVPRSTIFDGDNKDGQRSFFIWTLLGA